MKSLQTRLNFRDFKVPESEIVKTPIIAVCGDELGRIMISQYYGHLDLKTLGDKKPVNNGYYL